MISAITIIDNFIFTFINMLRALPSCSHFMTTANTPCRESAWRGSHRRHVILRLRWCCPQYFDGWVFKNIFLVNRWRYKIEYMWKLLLYINSIRCMPRNSCSFFLSFNDTVRICGDNKVALNGYTYVEQYPLPTPDICLLH